MKVPAAKKSSHATPKKKSAVSKAESGPAMSESMSAVLEQHSINRLNEDLAGRALDALRAYTEKTAKSKAKKDLFESDGEKVHMVVTLKRVPTQDQAGPKPIQLSLPHPVHGPGGDCDVCVFVKKDDKAWVKELLIEGENPVEGVKKVRAHLRLSSFVRASHEGHNRKDAANEPPTPPNRTPLTPSTHTFVPSLLGDHTRRPSRGLRSLRAAARLAGFIRPLPGRRPDPSHALQGPDPNPRDRCALGSPMEAGQLLGQEQETA